MFRSSRTTQSESAQRWVYPKIFIFVIGAALGLAGMAAHIDWLVTVAIAVLAVGVILKLVGDRQYRGAASDDDGGADDQSTQT